MSVMGLLVNVQKRDSIDMEHRSYTATQLVIR